MMNDILNPDPILWYLIYDVVKENALMMNDALNPVDDPILWYLIYDVVKENAPELSDQFIEETASRMDLTVDYIMEEFSV